MNDNILALERIQRLETEIKERYGIPGLENLFSDAMEFVQDYIAQAERVAELEAKLAACIDLANEAIEDIQSWGEYASDYFQEKHDLAGTFAQLKARAAEIEGTTDA